MESQIGASVPAFLRTHPLTDERVERVRKQLPEVRASGTTRPARPAVVACCMRTLTDLGCRCARAACAVQAYELYRASHCGTVASLFAGG